MTTLWQPGWVPGQQLTGFNTADANYAVTSLDRYIEANAASGSITLTLPDATECLGATYTFIRTDSATASNKVTIATTSGQTINGMSSRLLVAQYQLLTVISDGANWLVIDSNYAGTQLGYVESTTPATTTNTAAGSASLSVNNIPGLSITLFGTGLSVMVEFSGYGYNSAADTPFGAALLINAAVTGGDWAYGQNHIISGVGLGDDLSIRRPIVLTAGTSYTFTVGMWVSSGTGHFFADPSVPKPMFLSVVGQ